MAKAKKNWKMILLGVMATLGVALGGGALIRQLSNEKTKELPSYSYTIGAVTDAGKLDSEDKTSITSEKVQVEDLVSIEVAEGAKVQVLVHYFNEDGVYLSSAEVRGDTPSAPDAAKTFRVEIIPTDDDDGKITAFEKGDYAKAVTVTLKK